MWRSRTRKRKEGRERKAEKERGLEALLDVHSDCVAEVQRFRVSTKIQAVQTVYHTVYPSLTFFFMTMSTASHTDPAACIAALKDP